MRRMGLMTPVSLFASLLLLSFLPACGGEETENDFLREAGVEGGETGLATFEGTQIDLAADWGEAGACLVWQQAGGIECFRTEEEMDELAEQLEEADTLGGGFRISASQCSGWLRLYEHINYGGRVLQFRDRGFWQNLTNYGFNDKLSSYRVGPCGCHLAEHINGGGWWYPGNTSAGAVVSDMRQNGRYPSWNDRVSSLYIR